MVTVSGCCSAGIWQTGPADSEPYATIMLPPRSADVLNLNGSGSAAVTGLFLSSTS